MMNAILMAVVRFFETVVQYSLGAVLVALAVIGIVAAVRWLSDSAATAYPGWKIGSLRSGSGTLALPVVLAVVMALLGGLVLWAK